MAASCASYWAFLRVKGEVDKTSIFKKETGSPTFQVPARRGVIKKKRPTSIV